MELWNWDDKRAQPTRVALGAAVVVLLLVGVLAAVQPREEDESVSARPTAMAPGTDRPPGISEDQLSPGEPADSSADVDGPGKGDGDGSSSAPESEPTTADAPATEPAAGSETEKVPGWLPPGPGVRGADDSTIRLGMVTTDPAAVSTLVEVTGGPGGATAPAYDQVLTAAVEAVNARGGIAGRTVEPVIYNYDASSFFTASARQQESQRACSYWTEDNEVFAFHASGMTEEIALECALKNKTPMLPARYGLFPSQSEFERMAEYWYGPYHFLNDRRERLLGRFLLNDGFFGDDARVGLLVENKPSIREGVDKGMKPALAAAGIEPAEEILFGNFAEAPWSNYVLRLQAAGVTHVIWSTASTGHFPALFMLRAAEDQRYRPKWAVASDLRPAGLAASGAPEAQLKNVTGMGWMPWQDTEDTSLHSDNARECGEALKQRGQPEHDHVGQMTCDFLFFLQEAFAQADELSTASLASAMPLVADTYQSTMTIGGATRLGSGHHDGVRLVQGLYFDSNAGQFRYGGEPQAVQ